MAILNSQMLIMNIYRIYLLSVAAPCFITPNPNCHWIPLEVPEAQRSAP